MRQLGLISLSTLALLGACAKNDPILPGNRECVFSSHSLVVLDKDVSNLSNTTAAVPQECPCTQDSSNVIWHGNKKIFSGFPTSNFVKSGQKPVCSGKFVYAGLTTGELVKINTQTREITWLADIYRSSGITGGSAVLDITAPVIIRKDAVYVGGLGDAFCKLNVSSGAKIWCLDIGVGLPFEVLDYAAFVVGTDNYLYAINTTNGSIYWRQMVKKQSAPVYKNQIVTVGKERFSATSGSLID